MNNSEKIKNVMDISGVNEGDAIHALEMNEWDIVDALVYLKNNMPENQHTTNSAEDAKNESINGNENILDKALSWKFLVKKNRQAIGSYPLLLVLLAFIFIPKISLLLFILLAFMNYRFSVSGFSFATNINHGLEFIYVLVDKILVFLKKNKIIK